MCPWYPPLVVWLILSSSIYSSANKFNVAFFCIWMVLSPTSMHSSGFQLNEVGWGRKRNKGQLGKVEIRNCRFPEDVWKTCMRRRSTLILGVEILWKELYSSVSQRQIEKQETVSRSYSRNPRILCFSENSIRVFAFFKFILLFLWFYVLSHFCDVK